MRARHSQRHWRNCQLRACAAHGRQAYRIQHGMLGVADGTLAPVLVSSVLRRMLCKAA